MAQKPSIPKGTRDFSPVETNRRNYIFNTIKEVFRLFGYQQIETPSIENLSTLMGKYGDEGDKLLFKILNSGDFTKGLSAGDVENPDIPALTRRISEKGLRYDLTVPFARYVVQHRNEIQMPFKRFQIQPVWRADRPQKGRYREFYQCDADVVGSDSLNNEVELLTMADMCFNRLGVRITIKLNNRKILAGIAETIGEADRLTDITVAIDKIDKAGLEAVEDELRGKGISEDAIIRLRPVLVLSGSNSEKIAVISEILKDSPIGQEGIRELQYVAEKFDEIHHDADLEIDLSLARGLNYYTGTIIEIKARDAVMGSISGGGRYDNLTGVFGLDGVSGVGISFGADRIYDVMTQLSLFPESLSGSADVMFVNLGDEESTRAMQVANGLRLSGKAAIIYPDQAKIKKQMAYADAIGIPFVAFIGEDELKAGSITLKNMKTGEQQTVAEDKIAEILG